MKSRALVGVALIVVGLIGIAFLSSLYLGGLGWGNWDRTTGMWGRCPMCGTERYGGPPAYRSGSRISMDQAVDVAQRYLVSLGNPDLAIDEVMEFQYNFYVIYYEKSTGIRAFEMLIDPYNGQIFPEYGPNMMWNTKYGHMGGMMGGWRGYRGTPTANMPVTKEQAKPIAEDYLKTYFPGATFEDPDIFYGYYTIHLLKDGKIYGMFSINGYSGQVWYHNWHGTFTQMRELK